MRNINAGNRGFGLIELALVLVIFGLLVAGILASDAVIKSARLHGYVVKLQKYGTATQGFRNLYGSEPGDSSQLSPPGNGNKYLDGAGCNASSAAFSGIESTQVWGHMSKTGMIEGNFAPYSPLSCTGGTQDNEYRNLAGVIMPVFANLRAYYDQGFTTDKVGVSYQVDLVSGQYARYFVSSLPPTETRLLDQKLDDAVATTGVFTATEHTTGLNCYNYLTSTTSFCNFRWYPTREDKI